MGVERQLAHFWSTAVVTLTFLMLRGAQTRTFSSLTCYLFYCLHTATSWKQAGQLLILLGGDRNNALHWAKGRPETCKRLAKGKTAHDM